MSALEVELSSIITNNLKIIHNMTGYEDFFAGGSWVSDKLCETHAKVCQLEDSMDLVMMEANDIAVIHGSFTTDRDKTLCVKLNCIDKFEVDGLPKELNTVKCANLSPHTFLANNDLNIAASGIHVDFTKEKLFYLHISPCFWTFLFQKDPDRRIKKLSTLSTSTGMERLLVFGWYTKHTSWVSSLIWESLIRPMTPLRRAIRKNLINKNLAGQPIP